MNDVRACLSCFRNVKWSTPNNLASTLHVQCMLAKSKQQHAQGYGRAEVMGLQHWAFSYRAAGKSWEYSMIRYMWSVRMYISICIAYSLARRTMHMCSSSLYIMIRMNPYLWLPLNTHGQIHSLVNQTIFMYKPITIIEHHGNTNWITGQMYKCTYRFGIGFSSFFNSWNFEKPSVQKLRLHLLTARRSSFLH